MGVGFNCPLLPWGGLPIAARYKNTGDAACSKCIGFPTCDLACPPPPPPMSLLLRIQVSVQILIPLIFYSSQFILLILHSCEHLQSAGVCCDCCECIVSQECDSVTSALFQRLRYEFVSPSLFLTVSYFSFRQSVRVVTLLLI